VSDSLLMPSSTAQVYPTNAIHRIHPNCDWFLTMCKLNLHWPGCVFRYEDGYTGQEPQIAWFWEVVEAFDDAHRRQLLQFWSGSDGGWLCRTDAGTYQQVAIVLKWPPGPHITAFLHHMRLKSSNRCLWTASAELLSQPVHGA
jgi:hypothetical protein